ncbi:MAG: protein-glutamate O-methyltransferase CheR [Proteobacteria bacterium]|nr:protein-glutamate O-methyltransferase CheR [Pseudomonadota bacterium]
MMDDRSQKNHAADQGDDVEALISLIQRRAGLIWGAHARAGLRRTAEKRMSELALKGPSDYLALLDRNDTEWKRLVRELSSTTTSFFRNPSQFQCVVQALLPDLARRRQERSLTILSLGCSTGEEVYSLAMSVRDSGLPNKGWRIELGGLDIDELGLSSARAGLYSKQDLEALPEQLLQRWFRRSGGRFQVQSELRDPISWAPFNLADPGSWPWPDLIGRVDLILLKHVLADLTPATVEQAVDFLAELLAPDGILLIGPSEGLPAWEDRFVGERWGGVFYLRRRPGKIKVNPGHVSRKALRARQPHSSRPTGTTDASRPPEKALALLEKASASLAGGRPDRARPLLEAALDLAAEKGDLCPWSLGLSSRACLDLERWAEAADLARRIIGFVHETPWARILLAEALAALDRTEPARAELERAADMLKADPAWSQDPFFSLDPDLADQNPITLIAEKLAEE